MPKYAARVDENHVQIVAELRKDPLISVTMLHAVGRGCPDILVGYAGQNFLFELKTEHGELNENQIKFFSNWRGQVSVARNSSDILSKIKATVL